MSKSLSFCLRSLEEVPAAELRTFLNWRLSGRNMMAHIHIPDEGRRLDDAQEISAFLAPFGISYEKWDVERGVSPDASQEEILAAYAPEVNALQERGGYVTADV